MLGLDLEFGTTCVTPGEIDRAAQRIWGGSPSSDGQSDGFLMPLRISCLELWNFVKVSTFLQVRTATSKKIEDATKDLAVQDWNMVNYGEAWWNRSVSVWNGGGVRNIVRSKALPDWHGVNSQQGRWKKRCCEIHCILKSPVNNP